MLCVRTVDYHTAGEPFRIVLDGVPPIPGDSVAERRGRPFRPGGGRTPPARGGEGPGRGRGVKQPGVAA
ncbi:hypothetical protein ACFWXO_17015, partial [Kitasatospora sp. NPDC059088]